MKAIKVKFSVHHGIAKLLHFLTGMIWHFHDLYIDIIKSRILVEVSALGHF